MPTGKRPAASVEGPTPSLSLSDARDGRLPAGTCLGGSGRAGRSSKGCELSMHTGQDSTAPRACPARLLDQAPDTVPGDTLPHARQTFLAGQEARPFLRRPGHQHVWGANYGLPTASFCTAHQTQAGFTSLRPGKKQKQEHMICNGNHMWPAKPEILTFQLFTEFADLSDAEDTRPESSPLAGSSSGDLGSRAGLRPCTGRPLARH